MISTLNTAFSTLGLGLVAPLASAMSEGVRTALLGLLGLLVVIFGCLIAFAFVLRKQPQLMGRRTRGDEADELDDPASERSPARRDVPGPKLDAKVCPGCRREFDHALRFCPHDAIALVPAAKLLERESVEAEVTRTCPTCERAFQGEPRFCPHDGSELDESHSRHYEGEGEDEDHDHPPLASRRPERVRAEVASSSAGYRIPLATGHSLGHRIERDAMKICPRCRDRYGFGETFCGRDGVELVVLN